MNHPIVDIVIPARNEEQSIAQVIRDIPGQMVREIIVCDNNSTDRTSEIARCEGATVVHQPRKGYGSACLQGLAHIARKTQKPDIVVFLDGDYSDHPEQLPDLIDPIVRGCADLVIGSRALGKAEKGSMTFPQIFGNWLAATLIKMIYHYTFTDLGPFRAIRYDSLLQLKMADPDFGWTVEMQVKAARHKMACVEVPVDYRRRIGVSKVSGTVKGTILAGYKILWTIFKLY